MKEDVRIFLDRTFVVLLVRARLHSGFEVRLHLTTFVVCRPTRGITNEFVVFSSERSLQWQAFRKAGVTSRMFLDHRISDIL